MSSEIRADGTVELLIEKEFSHPPQVVFEAWLQPEQLRQWMGPTDDIHVSDVSVDAVEGGAYRMQFNDPDGTQHQLNGVYQTIERYTKLIFSWMWEPPTEGANEETLVTLDFIPTAKGTKLVLSHQRFSSVELRDRHDWGWNGTLEKLLRHLQQ